MEDPSHQLALELGNRVGRAVFYVDMWERNRREDAWQASVKARPDDRLTAILAGWDAEKAP